jgi:hypothetical protein
MQSVYANLEQRPSRIAGLEDIPGIRAVRGTSREKAESGPLARVLFCPHRAALKVALLMVSYILLCSLTKEKAVTTRVV